MMKRYWVDANAFIMAQRTYPLVGKFAFYWEWFEEKMDKGLIVTHNDIAGEVIKGVSRTPPDPIAIWVKNRRTKGLNLTCTDESRVLMGKISEWVLQKYKFAATNNFLRGCDALLIARVGVEPPSVLVTTESLIKEPRIPGICAKFNIDCINILEMNEKLGFNK
jgi:hypothetical protein